jgi:CheY-like chemotaxis protein
MSNVNDSLPLKKDREFLNLSPPNSLSLKSLRVLVVDDNIDSLFLTAFILEECGIEVVKAASAGEALKIFLDTKLDMLICDLAMPDEDGYSLIRKIRLLESEQGGQISAIALTASAGEENRSLSMEAGFQVHLAKPIEPGELVGVVAALARQF